MSDLSHTPMQMPRFRVVLSLVLVLVVPPVLSSQSHSKTEEVPQLRSLENAEFGFAFDLPKGWQRASDNLLAQVRSASSNPSVTEPLLMLIADGTGPPKGTVIDIQALSIKGVKGTDMDVGERYLEALFKKSKLTSAPEKVDFGGAGFYRVNGELPDLNQAAYYALFAAARRGRILIAEVRGDTAKARDDAATLLSNDIHFTPDWALPDSELDIAPQSHVHLGEHVPEPQDKKAPDGKLVKKMQPRYPPEGLAMRMPGTVVLKAEISRNGTIQKIWLWSASDPMFVTPAIEAVRQWRYKPYVLNGEPVMVDTEITIHFQPR